MKRKTRLGGVINVDHSVNTSIHYGEELAGRRQFVRSTMTPDGIVECPGFPGGLDGFTAIEEFIASNMLHVNMGSGAFIQAVFVKRLLNTTVELIKRNPLALLCQRDDCELCNSVRNT